MVATCLFLLPYELLIVIEHDPVVKNDHIGIAIMFTTRALKKKKSGTLASRLGGIFDTGMDSTAVSDSWGGGGFFNDFPCRYNSYSSMHLFVPPHSVSIELKTHTEMPLLQEL